MTFRQVIRDSWLLRLATWDVVLPICVAVSPRALISFAGYNEIAAATAESGLPIIAFALRADAGRRHILSNRCSRNVRWIQAVFLFLGMFTLFGFYELSMLMQEGIGPRLVDPFLSRLCAIYLAFMACATFPGRARRTPKPSKLEAGVDHTEPRAAEGTAQE